MLNEILAKINPREKLIGIGAIVLAVAWLLGLFITNSWYSLSGAQTMGLLALVAAIAAVVVIYIKYTPTMKITWPAPLPVIMLVIAGIAAVLALIGLYQAFSYDPYQGYGALLTGVPGVSGKPVTIYLAAGGVVVGAAIMIWGAYQEWTLNKAAV